jgi:hypothetical protein
MPSLEQLMAATSQQQAQQPGQPPLLPAPATAEAEAPASAPAPPPPLAVAPAAPPAPVEAVADLQHVYLRLRHLQEQQAQQVQQGAMRARLAQLQAMQAAALASQQPQHAQQAQQGGLGAQHEPLQPAPQQLGWPPLPPAAPPPQLGWPQQAQQGGQLSNSQRLQMQLQLELQMLQPGAGMQWPGPEALPPPAGLPPAPYVPQLLPFSMSGLVPRTLFGLPAQPLSGQPAPGLEGALPVSAQVLTSLELGSRPEAQQPEAAGQLPPLQQAHTSAGQPFQIPHATQEQQVTPQPQPQPQPVCAKSGPVARPSHAASWHPLALRGLPAA